MIGINNSSENYNQPYIANPCGLVERYGEMVYKIALLHTRNPHDAEEVFQEVFLRMMTYKDSFKSDEHAKAWLIRVTHTCSLKLLGSAWNRKTVSIEQFTTDHAITIDMHHEEIELYNAMAQLPEDIRLTLYLYYFMGYSVGEIARDLDATVSMIKIRLFRGRNKLRQILGSDIN